MKTVDEIYGEMLACFSEKTGVQGAEGGDLSARLYAVAAQIYALQVQADWVRRQAFPQTASGEYLDLHGAMRGLERKGALKAAGTVCFTGESGTAQTIPEGTVCMTTGLVRFVTTQEGGIPAGQTTAEIPVQAAEPGAAGNAPAGTVTIMAAAPVGVTACTNPAALSGGQDTEGDEALRERVLETYKRLPNGANAAYYQQQALAFDGVAACCVLPRNRGVGTVDVVVSAPGGVPDSALLAALTDWFSTRREIAVDVKVTAPETVTVNLTVRVKPAEGYTFQQAKEQATAAVTGWFTGRRLGQSVLLARMNSLIFGCDRVANCKVTAPGADVAVSAGQLPVLGALTVEELT